jgi:hypothetical protein
MAKIGSLPIRLPIRKDALSVGQLIPLVNSKLGSNCFLFACPPFPVRTYQLPALLSDFYKRIFYEVVNEVNL